MLGTQERWDACIPLRLDRSDLEGSTVTGRFTAMVEGMVSRCMRVCMIVVGGKLE